MMDAQILPKDQLDKLTKPLVVAYCIKLQENIYAQLTKAIALAEAVHSKVDLLTDRIEKLESEKMINKSVIKALNRQIIENTQYSRKETIEVHGVEEEVGSDDDLEDSICQLLSMSGEDVAPADLHACHRLSNSKQVIAKFKCRKKKTAVLAGKKNIMHCFTNKNADQEKKKQAKRQQLGFNKVWINESLSRHYNTMQWKCRMLHRKNEINSFWFYNGHLNIKLTETGNKLRIVDDDDLERETGINIVEFMKEFIKKDR